MKKLVNVSVLAGMLLGFGLWARADMDHKMPSSTPPSARASSPEFNELKSMAGVWQGTMTHSDKSMAPGPVTVEFKLTAAGSAIEETLMPGTPHEMVDMYTDESGKLAMMHYCAMGNQPHMVLKESGNHKISLEMGPSAGIDSGKDQHMHALVLELPDADHLNEIWTSYQNGKPAGQAIFTLARAAKK